MSRSKPRGGSKSPIKKYLAYSGSTGTFSYWDKEAEERVELDSLDIIVLDVRSSISGYDSDNKASISSNLVVDTTKEVMNVVSWKNGKATELYDGLYKDIKDKAKAIGGKFTSNVICLADLGQGSEICNLQLSGVSLGSWIEFVDENPNDAIYDYVITLNRGALSKRDGKENVPVTEKEEKALDAKLKKNPRAPRPIWYYVLDFSTEDLNEDQADLATEEDTKLQDYFANAGTTSVSDDDVDDTPTDAPTAPDVDDDDDDDLPF